MSVWRSNATAQFQKQPDITPVNGSFSVSLDANSIYSISTTTGQQKGATTPPAAAAFPFPYYETYDHYANFQSVGYRPYYHDDIAGGFELYKRPDGNGQCLRQVVSQPAQSWAPETNPYTIVGDTGWTNYEVSADVSIETTSGWASLLGRINSTGTGYGTSPNGYSMTLSPAGAYNFYASTTSSSTATTLANGQATLAAGSWHNMKLVFQGTSIKGLVDGTQVFSVTDSKYSKGNVGLGTAAKTTALFDNLLVNTVGGTAPAPTVFAQDGQTPPDGGAGGSTGTGGTTGAGGATGSGGISGAGGTTRAGGSTGAGGAAGAGGATRAGGTPAGGGTALSGGIPATGGRAGGTPASGGGTTVTGGTVAMGGNTAVGGNTGAAGGTSEPGTTVAGGNTGAPATTLAGGNTGAPATTLVGGNTGAAGSTSIVASGGSTGRLDTGSTKATSSASGCSCILGGTDNHGKVGLLLFATLAATAILRRRRNCTQPDT